jgi:rare lipoprotein A
MGKTGQGIEPIAEAPSETGIASYYGKGFHGRKTANGERFNMKAMTAAHRTLPLGTIVRVENLENHHFAVLKVNDRGPFIKGRILDVSQGAAKVLGFARQGVTQVKVTPLVFPDQLAKLLRREDSTPRAHDDPLSPSPPTADGEYAIKVAAYAHQEIAAELEQDLRPFFGLSRLSPEYVADKTYWRVLVGRYESKRGARDDLAKLKEFGHRGIVRKWKE